MKTASPEDRNYLANLEKAVKQLHNAHQYAKTTGASASMSQVADSLKMLSAAFKAAGYAQASRQMMVVVDQIQSGKKACDQAQDFFSNKPLETINLPDHEQIQSPAGESFAEEFGGMFIAQPLSLRASTKMPQRKASPMLTDIEAGMTVRFTCPRMATNMYDDPPAVGDLGVVTTVKVGGTQSATHENMVFVRWSNKAVKPVFAHHLSVARDPLDTARAVVAKIISQKFSNPIPLKRLVVAGIQEEHIKQAAQEAVTSGFAQVHGGRIIPIKEGAIRVASLGNLDFLFRHASDDTLIHKATQDVWSVRKSDQGYLIEKMVDDTKAPIKI